MWFEAANLLATKIVDSTVAEAFSKSIHQLMEEWQNLKYKLNKTENRLKNVLDKANDFDRFHKEISDWLAIMLDKIKHMDRCAAQVSLISDQIDEANVCLTDYFTCFILIIPLFMLGHSKRDKFQK